MPKLPLNKFEELKRNRYIKKICSNAIAIKTGQIEIHSGCMKMEKHKNWIDEIETLQEIDLEVFKKYYCEFKFYPIGKEREKYSREYLQKLDVELNLIDEKHRQKIMEKCDEIIDHFKNIDLLFYKNFR